MNRASCLCGNRNGRFGFFKAHVSQLAAFSKIKCLVLRMVAMNILSDLFLF
jgi:hypothetical protein